MPVTRFRADVLEVRDELRKAEAALDIRRYDLAIEMLQKMLKEHPENSAVFYTLARASIFKKNMFEASRLVCEALRLDPRSSQAHTLYGNILSNMGKVNEAETEYRTSLEIQPDVAYTHYMYAALLVDKRKDFVRAAEHARKALELDPAAALHHMTMAKILAMQGKFAEAEEGFRRALSLDPENIVVCRVYGWYFLYKRNDPERAFEYLRQAMQLDPNDPATRKIFLIALKAKQKRYRFIWYFTFLLYKGGRIGRIIFGLVILALIIAQSELDGIWGTNPLYQIVSSTLTLLFLTFSGCVLVFNVMLGRMIRREQRKELRGG